VQHTIHDRVAVMTAEMGGDRFDTMSVRAAVTHLNRRQTGSTSIKRWHKLASCPLKREELTMPHRIRRVVTGLDSSGRSVFISDELAAASKEMESFPGLVLTNLWVTDDAPASNAGNDDAAARPIVLEPPPRGTVFRIVEFPPDSAWRGHADGRDAFASIGAAHAQDTASGDPMMHKTATVDYLVVLKGEIWAILEDGETCLRAGDVMIQRGTNHSWSVRTPEPCVLLAVLIDAH
jgi:mannose-6-phosphate isomerase-like protein (cupin superfamily)